MKMLPIKSQHGGYQNREAFELGNQAELIEAIAGRYHAAARTEKKQILDEFIEVGPMPRYMFAINTSPLSH
jgi:hypothetical protein